MEILIAWLTYIFARSADDLRNRHAQDQELDEYRLARYAGAAPTESNTRAGKSLFDGS